MAKSPLTQFHITKKMFNPSYLPHLEDYSHRFNVYYGGAGSGKSQFVIQKMIFKYLKYANRLCLVVRKVDNTLRFSTFALFKSILADWNLYDQCEIRETLLTIVLPNGSQFIFKGLEDSEKIKSIANIDDIIIEECTEISLDDFTQLNLRLRSKNPYNQVHCMFNPVSKANWVYLKWFASEYDKKSTIILHTTYKDNIFLPQEYIDSIKEYEISNPVYYKVYVLGEFATLDKLIFNNWTDACFDYKAILKDDIKNNIEAVFGLDFGYTNDPTAFVCALIDRVDKKLWIFDEFQQKGLTNDEIAKKVTELAYQKEKIVCDSAEPKSIEELKKNGLERVIPATKGRDSILNGIQYLQQFNIIIHSRNLHMIEEFSNYTWKKDKNGIYINVPIDKFNHGIDALRYAVNPVNTMGTIKVFNVNF
ncbi:MULTISPECIES: PBSX family phage terminase large subunit [Clostridium]|uniref:PBSX family phage terminase large subunit n=1 Tax=Clostridium frigoriphilum TaxID=443253 RepID=A0ABU7UU65_9CLOT|nr:PBSX family phage terminase large subunit [Clostridium sp. DSM 17811]MBU3098735.1 PBSX family phage terminase large subunit [Clostridium sp. DSM 17811]